MASKEERAAGTKGWYNVERAVEERYTHKPYAHIGNKQRYKDMIHMTQNLTGYFGLCMAEGAACNSLWQRSFEDSTYVACNEQIYNCDGT